LFDHALNASAADTVAVMTTADAQSMLATDRLDAATELLARGHRINAQTGRAPAARRLRSDGSSGKRRPAHASQRHPKPKPPGIAPLLLAPIHFIARILFSDLRLEREGRNLHIRIAATTPDHEPHALTGRAIAEAAPLRAALKELLDSHPLARKVLSQLRYFECALRAQGLAALAGVPVEVLAVALKQLDSIVANWSNRHLADLRSKMAIAVLNRSEDPFHSEGVDRLSNFATESRLLVGDASHSVFLELERQYQALLPQETIRASLGVTKAAQCH
jgi:hypothetical protein